jgi:hypothetical protein
MPFIWMVMSILVMPIAAFCSRDILVVMLRSLSNTEEIQQVALGATFLIFELAVIYLVLGKFNLLSYSATDD